MCGIAGFLDGNGRRPEAEVLARLGGALRHRGPDAFATLLEGPLGLAHCRLSLLDLSPAGNQPFVVGRHALVFNGELYNFRELRAELGAEGVQFRSTSDTEVLLHLLVRRGVPATLAAVDGMFAFAYADLDAGRLVLARDRVGIKPLFYRLTGATLHFASELKALLALGAPPLEATAVFYAALGILEKARERTAFRGIRQLAAGTWLSYGAGDAEPHLERYFTPADWVDAATWRRLSAASPAAVADELETLLTASVERMRVADAPMGAFVSGGVDSSLLAALAERRGGERIQSLELFTAAVEGPLSEAGAARRLARHLGRPLHEFPFAPADFVAGWVDATWHYESPLVVHANAVPFLGVARLAARHGVKAVLTGEGADELFLGYPAQAAARFDKVVYAPRRLLDRFYGAIPGLGRHVGGVDSLLGELEMVAQGFERQTLRAESLARFDFLPPERRREQYQSLQMLSEGLLSLLWRNDRMGMAASIEARFPFLDEDVLRFAINLPAAAKLGRSWRLHDLKHPFLVDKAPLRRVAARHLPRELATKRKNGFPVFGLRHLRVDAELFQSGFWQSFLEWRPAQVASWLEVAAPYNRARYAGVEIWGRLFHLGQSRDAVRELVARTVRYRGEGAGA